jgi:hypothetical protein
MRQDKDGVGSSHPLEQELLRRTSITRVKLRPLIFHTYTYEQASLAGRHAVFQIRFVSLGYAWAFCDPLFVY